MSDTRFEHPEELLPWYVNGSLDEAEHLQVEEHLGRCLVCRRQVEELETLRQAVQDTSGLHDTERPGEDGVARLLDALEIEEHRGERRRAPGRRWRAHWPLAAVLVIALGATTLLESPWPTPPPVVERAAGNEAALRVSPDLGAALPRDDFVLRWETTEPWRNARFSLLLTTTDLGILHEIRDLEIAEYQVPAEILEALPASTTLLWRVEAIRPGGESTRSATFSVNLR